MIPRAAITEWANKAPWKDMHNIEQDLLISRTLVAIFSDDFLSAKLAFRGGTAIHKLYLPPPKRYSEDIDLVQVNSEPIGQTLDRLKEVLSFIGDSKTRQKMSNNVLLFQFETTFPPVSIRKLKIEINCKEHFTELGKTVVPFSMENQWYSGGCKINTYTLDELMGTKIRALYQRKKGRDLFDLYCAIESGKLDLLRTVKCYKRYISFPDHEIPSAKEYALNLKLKIADPGFRQDITPILSPGTDYNIDLAYKKLLETILVAM
ncbi:nucleotidyl transferase AbiEii/AbiGii toxin family protein [Treponema primitia]|uniref:nucleotidyl transferase AbiEii/AbiGii toxin family protein n=1 Tax=Treponema primitia TaxID=88058 RepID=UPI00025550FF|nr:nucleotidyl transferase AbiEii/AbiGii toxin family protein [Treponema primitia]